MKTEKIRIYIEPWEGMSISDISTDPNSNITIPIDLTPFEDMIFKHKAEIPLPISIEANWDIDDSISYKIRPSKENPDYDLDSDGDIPIYYTGTILITDDNPSRLDFDGVWTDMMPATFECMDDIATYIAQYFGMLAKESFESYDKVHEWNITRINETLAKGVNFILSKYLSIISNKSPTKPIPLANESIPIEYYRY